MAPFASLRRQKMRAAVTLALLCVIGDLSLEGSRSVSLRLQPSFLLRWLLFQLRQLTLPRTSPDPCRERGAGSSGSRSKPSCLCRCSTEYWRIDWLAADWAHRLVSEARL